MTELVAQLRKLTAANEREPLVHYRDWCKVAADALEQQLRNEEMSTGWFEMIREDLEGFGLDMKGCSPMMYNDAIRNLVARLAKHGGLTTADEVRKVVRVAAMTEGEK